MTTDTRLTSWRPGPARDSIVSFLDAAAALPPVERVAVFDHDGTLWCERPSLPQLDFAIDALASAAAADPALRGRVEYAAALDGDVAAIEGMGLERVAMSLLELFSGMTPVEFDHAARAFIDSARHPTLGVPLRHVVYQPMLDLLAELRHLEFAVFIVTGGGTDFVRAVSHDLYGVPPEAVIGTSIAYEFLRDDDDQPVLRRTAQLASVPNEGAAKVHRIQAHLGRRPILGVGNSAGDREMLEWACAGDGPGLALLVHHDDEVREFAYQGEAETFAVDEPIVDVGRRLGWTVVSMADDWATIFPDSHFPDSRDRGPLT
jgi:phosphoserine phosphatase